MCCITWILFLCFHIHIVFLCHFVGSLYYECLLPMCFWVHHHKMGDLFYHLYIVHECYFQLKLLIMDQYLSVFCIHVKCWWFFILWNQKMLDIKILNVASHVIVRYFLMLENVRHNENIMHIDLSSFSKSFFCDGIMYFWIVGIFDILYSYKLWIFCH